MTVGCVFLRRGRQGVVAATGNLESAWPMADLSLAELDFINRQLSWGTRLIPGLRSEQEPLSSAPIQDFGSAELTHAVLAGYGAEHDRRGGVSVRELARLTTRVSFAGMLQCLEAT